MEYKEFIESKRLRALANGIEIDKSQLSDYLYDFQLDIVHWSLLKGRSAVFADTGLGKTHIGLEWVKQLNVRTLMVAPLAVCRQTNKMAAELGINIEYVKTGESVAGDGKFWCTNWENVHKFQAGKFQAIWLDESSILKNISGKMRTRLIEFASHIDYRLCTSATPAPNDTNELGNHAEFLGVQTSIEMSSMFFVHDAGVFRGRAGGNKSRWRLKTWADQGPYWRWLASWAIAIRNPDDLGYDGSEFILPTKIIHEILVDVEVELDSTVKASDGTKYIQTSIPGIYANGVSSAEIGQVKRKTLDERIDAIKDMVNDSDEQWIIWCSLNDEATALNKALDDSVNVHGAMKPDDKADSLMGFIDGQYKVLISKTKIAGFGLNMQQCRNMVFFSIDYSWEKYYQATRRIWRYGQTREVNIYVVYSNAISQVFETILSKEREAETAMGKLIDVTREYSIEELSQSYHEDWKYQSEDASGDGWTMWLGDSCQRMQEMPDNSVDLIVYSPPFSDLYVYTASELDLSNNASWDEFMEHYRFIVKQNLRCLKPGRICAVHVQDVKTFKNKDGYRGLKDFAGDVIKLHIDAGWIYRSTVTINKNPQIVASRNKDIDLLFVTGKRDATNLAPAPPDYFLVFRKPGNNEVPVLPYVQPNSAITESDWIQWAHPVWSFVKETDVLNVRQARANEDEKHMCPLQLGAIEPIVRLYSNEGEVVFSPFGGIASEGYESLRWRRHYHGIELKPEYWKVACQNLSAAENLNGVNLLTLIAQSENESE